MSTEKRVRVLVLRKKTLPDESLLLETLSETGEKETFKLPGIFKSTKRSAFFYAPGALCEACYHPRSAQANIPKSLDIVFSPFHERQDYWLLNAVAEILVPTDFILSGKESAPIFHLAHAFLKHLPSNAEDAERHLDRYYWELLKLLGLAHDEADLTRIECFELGVGFLTAHEASVRSDSGLRLSRAWIDGRVGASESQSLRQIICRYLKSL